METASELKNLLDIKVTVILIVNGKLETFSKALVKGLEVLEKEGNRNHTDSKIIKICQNIKKSHRDLRSIAVTPTWMKNYQLTLVCKTLK